MSHYMLGGVNVGYSHPVRVMGIINASPESFYKKSIKSRADDIKKEIKLIEEGGARYIDVGGMSTAPYIDSMVSEETEKRRIQNAIKAISEVSRLPISVDTIRSGVAQAAIESGATILNDVTGFNYDKKMLNVISRYSPDIVLCAHSSQKSIGTAQDTAKILEHTIQKVQRYGADKTRMVIDPCIGFFRDSDSPWCTQIDYSWVQRDIDIIQHLRQITEDMPILVSVSNKSFIGSILDDRSADGRLYGSIAAEVMSVVSGADIIRTHNVQQSLDAIRVASAIIQRKYDQTSKQNSNS